MPLASGSFPYPKSSSKNAVSPTKDELDSFTNGPSSQHTDTRASSQTYRSTFDNIDDKLGADKLASPSNQSTVSQPVTSLPSSPSAANATAGRYVLPLEERPNDQKRIRKLISSSPLIAVAAVFAAFSVFLSVSATKFTWLDYSEKFNNLVKGVETTTRYQWYQDREVICTSAKPSGVDPDVIEGCVDHGTTNTFMIWLPILNEAAMVFGAIALGLCVFSSRHIRWWIAKFTSPTARIMFLVGDVTGACGSEPEWCKPLHCRDCGILCTPATPGIFASISAILHLISFTVYWFISRPKAMYRTEGPWLIITAGGLQMGCAFFAFWSQKVVCPVKHVWKCECDCKMDKAKDAHHKRQAMDDDGNADEEELSQGLPHVIAMTTYQADRARQFIRHQSSRLMVKSNEVASKLATRIRQKALERLPRNPDEEDDEEEEEALPTTPQGPTGPFSKPYQPRELKSVTLVGSMKRSARRTVPPGQTLQARALLLKRQGSDESVHAVLSPSDLNTSIESFPVVNSNINRSTDSTDSTGLGSPDNAINASQGGNNEGSTETVINMDRYE